MSSRYRIYCDGELFSDSYIPDPAWHAQEPHLKLADNSAGSFEFVLTSENVAYNKIERMASTIVVACNNDILWSGRIIQQSEDFFKRRKYVGEGALTYLNDSNVTIEKKEGHIRDLLVDIIYAHNEKMTGGNASSSKPSAYRQILAFKNNIVIEEASTEEYEFNNESVLEWMADNVIDAFGCHAYIKYGASLSQYLSNGFDPKPTLYIQDDYTAFSEQEINFGVNLIDFTKNWDLSNLVTVILPRGAQLTTVEEEVVDTDNPGPLTDKDPDDGLTHYLTVKYAILSKEQIGSVNGKPKYRYTYYGDSLDPDGNPNDIYVYNASAYAQYGRIEKVVDFSDITDPTYLLKLSRIYVRSLQFNGMQIEISAIDLHHIDNTMTRFNILDQVRCISKPHGMNTIFPIVEMELDLENPGNDKYTLGGDNVTTLSGINKATTKKLSKQFKGYPSPSLMLDAARYEASVQLNNYRIRGYVNLVQESNTSQAIVITDTQDWTKASNIWKWDMNGLGFSDSKVAKTGYTQYELEGTDWWFKTAITKNGHIVADFIDTGILSDGAGTNGNNWWDLTNGEFHLQGSAVNVKTDNGDDVTISDIVDGVNDAQEEAAGAAQAVNGMEIGGANLLDGTKTYDGWRMGPSKQWSVDSSGIAACKAPTATNWKYFLISPRHRSAVKGKKEYKPPTYKQLKSRQCVLSFEVASDTAWGTGGTYNRVVVRFALEDGAGKQVVLSKNFTFYPTTKWTKKTIKFSLTNVQSGLNLTPIKHYSGTLTPKNSSGAYTGKWDNLYFTVRIYNISKKKIQIRHIKLEQGNKSTAWCESEYDSQKPAIDYTYEMYTKVTKDYKAAIDKSRLGFSKEQNDLLKDYTSRLAILKKLTGNDNTRKNGLYVYKGELYMNATFIDTGYLKANLIKTGLLMNTKKPGSKGSFYFDLDKGVVKATNMVLTNMQATGTIDNGTAAKTVIKNGSLNFYYKNKMYARIASVTGIMGSVVHGPRYAGSTDPNSLRNGLFMSADGPIFIRSDGLFVNESRGLDTGGTYYEGLSKEFDFEFIPRIDSNGDTFTWYYARMIIKIVNGLIVDMYINY